MKKGDVIWIRCNNCLYCSEISEVCIRKIAWTDGRVEEYETHVYLVPIVGDIDKVVLGKGQDCTEQIVIGWVYSEKQFLPYAGALISCDFDLISRYIKTNNSE